MNIVDTLPLYDVRRDCSRDGNTPLCGRERTACAKEVMAKSNADSTASIRGDCSFRPEVQRERTTSLQHMLPMCYKRIMRDWVREKLMRRRKKPVTNNSESTGKIGHEIPQDQPTPLQPSYPQPLEHEDAAKVPARADRAEDHSCPTRRCVSSVGDHGAKRSGRHWRNRHGNRSEGQASGGESRRWKAPQSNAAASTQRILAW